MSSSKALAQVLEAEPVPPLKKPYLHLALSLPRLSKIDSLIEKFVELGVKEFHPFTSAFSFFKKASSLSSARSRRWKKIVEQSLAVSGRTEPLLIHPCLPLEDIAVPREGLALMAYEGEAPSLLKWLDSSKKPPAVWLFIGSEGGFSQKEAEEFSLRENGFVFSMGDQILKVETACLFGLSALKFYYHL